MWLNPDVFEWRGTPQGSMLHEDDLWKRAHQIWAHVEQILGRAKTELDRANAIMDLRRAIDRRVRMISDRYGIRNIPLGGKPSDSLELLAFMGVVRPRMLQRLIDIRNAVEHEDAEPPDMEACQTFLEVTWYFLKSTDRMVQFVLDSILFEQNAEGGYWVEVTIRPPDTWIPKVRGWLPPDLISPEAKDKWIPLKLERSETREEAVLRLKDDTSNLEELESYGWGKDANDRYFTGEMRGPGDALKSLYKLYFSLAA